MVVSLELAMEYLHATGRTFRAERVPLCYMKRFAWASTETRKIVKEEERCISFLTKKGLFDSWNSSTERKRLRRLPLGFDLCRNVLSGPSL